jgi:hypothetical protein
MHVVLCKAILYSLFMYVSTVRSTILVGNKVILACSGTTVTSIFEFEQLIVSNLVQELLAVSKIETTTFEPTVAQELLAVSKSSAFVCIVLPLYP